MARTVGEEAKSSIDAWNDSKAMLAGKPRMAAQEANFNDVAGEWIRQQAPRWSDRHRRSVEGALRRHVLPALGRRPIAAIHSADVLDTLKELTDRGQLETATRCRQRIASIFDYAMTTRRCEANPAVGIRSAPFPTRHEPKQAIEPDEFLEILQRIDSHAAPIVRLALKFMVLTVARPREMHGACWCEFDLERREWCIPAERMLTRREHIVPLSAQAIAVLDELKTYTGGRLYAFSSGMPERPLRHVALVSALHRLRGQYRTTFHGFRRFAFTLLWELQIPTDVVEHQFGNPWKRLMCCSLYPERSWLGARHQLMQKWADRLDDIRRVG